MSARDDFNTPGTTAQLRVPPHSVESESSVLSGLMLDTRAWDIVGDLLTDSDFYRYEHRLVYAAATSLALANRPVDVFTVHEALKAAGKDGEAGGLPYLTQLAQYVPSARNIRSYAEIVREHSIRRQLISKADAIATKAFAGQTGAAVLLDEAEREIGAIAEKGGADDEWSDATAGMTALLDHIQRANDPNEAPDYVSTGIPEIDEALDGGLRGSEFYVFGGRPGMGKSQLAQTIGDHVALVEGRAVVTWSMEMPKSQHWQRMAARQGRIHLSNLRRSQRMGDQDWSNLTRAVDAARNLPVLVNDKPGRNINQIRSGTRAAARRLGGKLGLVIVDYLQLMTGTDPRMPRTYQLEEASRGLKSLAKELDCPVIALVQVGRGVEKELDPMPRMSDIRDCGGIEQDADVVGFLHRPIILDQSLKADATQATIANGQGSISQGDLWKLYARFGLVKMRAGSPCEIALQCEGQYQTFASWNPLYPIPKSASERARSGAKGGSL